MPAGAPAFSWPRPLTPGMRAVVLRRSDEARMAEGGGGPPKPTPSLPRHPYGLVPDFHDDLGRSMKPSGYFFMGYPPVQPGGRATASASEGSGSSSQPARTQGAGAPRSLIAPHSLSTPHTPAHHTSQPWRTQLAARCHAAALSRARALASLPVGAARPAPSSPPPAGKNLPRSIGS